MDQINQPMIALEDIHFRYPQVEVLRAINFSLFNNEKIGLMGPTGIGKTTLLQIMVGLLLPSSGRIQIFGNVMKSEKDFAKVRPRIGFLFQHADQQLFSPTVLEDVAFGPLNLGMNPQEAKEVSWETLKRLELEHLAERVTHHLSGGQKKLVALATLLSMSPQVLLLDEPTTGLDPATKNHVIEILKNLDTSYLIVSHHQEFLAETAKTILTLSNGRIEPQSDDSEPSNESANARHQHDL